MIVVVGNRFEEIFLLKNGIDGGGYCFYIMQCCVRDCDLLSMHDSIVIIYTIELCLSMASTESGTPRLVRMWHWSNHRGQFW